MEGAAAVATEARADGASRNENAPRDDDASRVPGYMHTSTAASRGASSNWVPRALCV